MKMVNIFSIIFGKTLPLGMVAFIASFLNYVPLYGIGHCICLV